MTGLNIPIVFHFKHVSVYYIWDPSQTGFTASNGSLYIDVFFDLAFTEFLHNDYPDLPVPLAAESYW